MATSAAGDGSEGEESKFYSMRSIPKGICVIINNGRFRRDPSNKYSRELQDRPGTELDKDALHSTFVDLLFDVRCSENLRHDQMNRLMQDMGRLDHSAYDCFVCCVLSHGYLGHVYGSDGVGVAIKELTSHVKPLHCRSLTGKPKLFFIQACQGDVRQKGYGSVERDDDPTPEQLIPNEQDFLLSYSTVPGFVSYRDTTSGSFFVKKLTQSLRRHAETMSILDILTEVNELVGREYKLDQEGIFKQSPAPMFTLRKKLVLGRGIAYDHRRPIQASSSDFGSSLRVDSEVLQAGRRPVDVETAKRRGAHKEDKSDHSAIDVDAAFSGPMSLSSKVVNVLDFQRDGQKTAILQDASHVLAPKEDLVAIHSSSTKESEFSQSSIDAATLNTAFEQEGSSSSGFVYRSSRVRLSSPLSDITPTHSLAQSGESTHKEGELSHPEKTKTPSVKELSGGLTNRKETPIGEELSGELTKVEGTPTVEEQLTKYDEIQESVVNSVTVASPSSAANVVKGESSSSSKATTLSVQTELPTKAEASQTGGKPSKGSTALYTAASAGHLAVVKILLDRGGIDADVAHCGCGKTPLYAAAIGGHLDIVEMLLKYGADVNAETDEANGKETPLLAALRNKHSAVVKLLLEYGANTEVYTVRGQFRPLYGAAMNGDLDIMRLILERGADVNVQTVDGSTALNLAAQIGHAEMAMLLLEFKANLEIATFSLGVKPLLNAVQHGHIAVVDLLLKAGANVESMTKFGDTALHVAAKTGRASIAHLLLQNGADAEAAEPDCGIRPLHFAAKQGNVDVAKVLLQNGAQVDSESFDKTTPLFVASLSGHRHVVEVLLDHGASMDTSNREDGCKPLHAAARIGHLDVVQLYLQRGADIDSADKDGGTMLSFASFHGRTGVVKLLLDHGANTEGANKSLLEHDTNTEGASKFPPEDCTEGATVNRMGKRPLCLAAMNGHVDVARLLLEHGANTQSVNLSAENKPLSLAASNGYVNIVQLLLEHESIMGEEAPDVENVPLSLAVVNGHEDFVKLLLDYASRRKQQNT